MKHIQDEVPWCMPLVVGIKTIAINFLLSSFVILLVNESLVLIIPFLLLQDWVIYPLQVSMPLSCLSLNYGLCLHVFLFQMPTSSFIYSCFVLGSDFVELTINCLFNKCLLLSPSLVRYSDEKKLVISPLYYHS